MSSQIPDKDYVYSALLRHNYLPMGKLHPDDIPFKVFSTEDFTPDVVNEMLQSHEMARNKGCDQIEYRTNRFNNVTRLMHIPHPLPYARLCRCISESWAKLSHICKNCNSLLKPAQHDNRRLIMGEYEDFERVLVMDSEKFRDRRVRLEISTGQSYRVEADISSYFPSIYTHSIPWALVGKLKAKSTYRESDKWYNKLDKAQRGLKKNETKGIPIGPATSHIMSEIILYKIDEALRKEGYQFTRYVDDYKCYCDTRENAEMFILSLERELRKYLLNLNPRKVLIEELPLGLQEQWVIVLGNGLPSKQKPSPRDIMNFLDSAIELQKRHPEANILKYATRALANSKKFDKNSASFFLEYLVVIAFHVPSVLPVLCQVAKEYGVGSDLEFDSVLKQSIKFRRSDAICWSLYFMGTCGEEVSDDFAKDIVESEDCMAMGMLIALNQHREKIVDFLDDNINPDLEYDCDQYWILIHELAPDCPQFNDYRGESGLEFLRNKDVHFINLINSGT
jgi:hypothetical protein